MQDGFIALLLGAFKEIAFVRLKEFRQVSPGLINAFIRHFQHPVMLETIPELLHLFRQLIGQQIGKILQKLVRQLFWQKANFVRMPVDDGFHAKELGNVLRAKLIDDKKAVFAVFFRDVVNVAMNVFARNWQIFKLAQNVAAHLRQHRWVIRTHVKHFLLCRLFIGVDSYSKYRQLTGTARGFF